MERNIDELNLITYEDYFSKMPISKKQKADRVKAAQEFEDIFLYFITMLGLENDYGTEQKSVKDFIAQYAEAVKKYNSNDNFIALYVALIASEVAEATLRHIDEKYYTSLSRAQILAANEANSVLNQTDFDNAIASGYKRKQWLTEMDDKVRPTHIELEGKTIPINDLFVVGSAIMRFPHDYEMASGHPEELASCRCAVAYLR